MITRVCLLPLDSRPVCYEMPRYLGEAAGISISLPAPSLLGELKKPANVPALLRWLRQSVSEHDAALVALDTLAYGGLIPSRVGHETLEEIEDRTHQFFEGVPSKPELRKPLYGFSSIMRIPDYNLSEEEPEYWATYGRRLYQYSVEFHQHGKTEEVSSEGIPPEVLQDFTERRSRNYSLNRSHVKRLASEQLDYLVFCQDDTGRHGINVQESNALKTQLKRKNLTGRSMVLTGADEIPSCLLARCLSMYRAEPIKVYPFYSSERGRKVVARFDGITVEEVVAQRIRLCHAEEVSAPEEADLWLLVHTPDERQGDHCHAIDAQVASFQVEQILQVMSRAFQHNRPLALADVAYANGSDPNLSLKLLSEFEDLTQLYGYAGWNTPGNTIGTAVAMGMIRLMAEENNTFNAEVFNRLLLIRFTDDWLYQGDIRQSLRKRFEGKETNGLGVQSLDTGKLNVAMADGLHLLKDRLHLLDQSVTCYFPLNRTFEIGVQVGEDSEFQLSS